jgi:hypothetical protein
LFVDDEVPAGAVDGVNAVFILTKVPSPVGSLELYRNGLQLRRGTDYSLSGFTVTFFAGSIPGTGDLLMARYRYADASNPLSSLASPQVVCSSVGSATSTTALNSLGSCTIPAGLLGTGDRIEIRFHYDHTGTATTFTGEVRWGATVLISRSGATGDGALRGAANIGVYSGGQSWDVQSWGALAVQALGAGSAAENTATSVTISLNGSLGAATADSLVLRNFTVIRHPAQANP